MVRQARGGREFLVDYWLAFGCGCRIVSAIKVYIKKMIIEMNIIIFLIGAGGIIVARNLVWRGTGMGIKSHLIILTLKLIVSSIIIGLFLLYTEKHIWSLLILSGMINVITFHFIEAFVTQKKLLYQRGMNV